MVRCCSPCTGGSAAGCRPVVTWKPTDASIEGAALREASEESGLDDLDLDHDPLLLSEHEVPCGIVRPTFHLDVQFLVRSESATAPVVGAESLAVQWFRHDQLPEVDDSVSALVRRAAIRLGW